MYEVGGQTQLIGDTDVSTISQKGLQDSQRTALTHVRKTAKKVGGLQGYCNESRAMLTLSCLSVESCATTTPGSVGSHFCLAGLSIIKFSFRKTPQAASGDNGQ